MNNYEKRIDNFLLAIEQIFSGMDPKTFWPLNGGQIDSYFDVIEALDMYDLLSNMKKTMSIEEITKIMPPADVIRLFLEHNAIIGLKVANKLGIREISTEDKVNYLNLIFDILQTKAKNDIFCLDGKNILLDEQLVENELDSPNWDSPSTEDTSKIASLIVTANNLAYTLFYDIFMAGGFYIHGPYNSTKEFGRNTCMIIREFHNLNPKELWPELKNPYEKIRVIGVYKHLDLKINFANHPISTHSVGDKLIAFKIYVNDKKVSIEQVPEIIETLQAISSEQYSKITSLPDLDKVNKGAEIAYYLFKELREYNKQSWRPPKQIEQNIKTFGDKFVKQFKYTKSPSLEHWKKLFDPRNDYY